MNECKQCGKRHENISDKDFCSLKCYENHRDGVKPLTEKMDMQLLLEFRGQYWDQWVEF